MRRGTYIYDRSHTDCTDLLKRNGFKIIKLEENFYKLTRLDERGKVDGTIRKDETDAG